MTGRTLRDSSSVTPGTSAAMKEGDRIEAARGLLGWIAAILLARRTAAVPVSFASIERRAGRKVLLGPMLGPPLIAPSIAHRD